MDMTELQVNRLSSALRNACHLAVACCGTKNRFRLRCAYFVTSEKILEITSKTLILGTYGEVLRDKGNGQCQRLSTLE
jgi:hypothetical protein